MSPRRRSDPPPGPTRPATSVSNTELDVLKVLWEHGSGTVREIQARLEERGTAWAYTTVQTLLHRLRAKGCVSSEKAGIALVFRAELSREGMLRGRLRDLADQLTDGLTSPLVQALVRDRGLTDEEIEEFRRLIDEASGRTGAPQRGDRPNR